MEHYINLFFSVYLHICLLFCFLTLFFWLVISKTESKNLNNEIISGINNNLKDIHIPDSIFNDSEANYFSKYYEGEDQTIKRNNSQLLTFNIIIIILLLLGLFGCIFVRYIFCKQTINIAEIIGENILILILVGIIEYYFFMNIASKYVPIMPSYLPKVIQNKINQL